MAGVTGVACQSIIKDLVLPTPFSNPFDAKRQIGRAYPREVDPPPRTRKRNAAPAWSTGAAQFQNSIDSDEDARTAYHRDGVAATIIEAKLADRLAEIENRALRRDRERKRAEFSKAGKTANELRLIYRDGGNLDDDRQGHAMFSILLHTIANTGGNVVAKMDAARREFAPWLPDADMAKLADEAIRVRRRWTADKLAQRIGLTYADRQRLRITMIGAIDVPKAERDRLRKARKVEARREKRRQTGVIPRDQYRAHARVLKAEAAALGLTYDTLRKRKQRATAALSQVRPHHKETRSIAGVTLGTPHPAPLQSCDEGSLACVRPPSTRRASPISVVSWVRAAP